MACGHSAFENGLLHVKVISFTEALELQKYNKSELWIYFWEYTKQDVFLSEIQRLYRSCKLSSQRLPLLEQAIFLHANSYFGGSVTLLYSQIEGIITEALIHAKSLGPEGKKYILQDDGIDQLNKNSKPIPITGLCGKLSQNRNLSPELKEYFNFLSAYKLIHGSDTKFTELRNEVLHGSNLTFYTNYHLSIQLSLCLYSLVYALSFIEFQP